MTAAQRRNARHERIWDDARARARARGAKPGEEFDGAELVRQHDPREIEKSTRG